MGKEDLVSGVRKALRLWQSQSGAPATQETLRDVLHIGTHPSTIEADLVKEKITKDIKSGTERFSLRKPSWIRRDGLLTMVSELSSSAFWNKLLLTTPKDIRNEIVGDTSQTFISELIAVQNAQFITKSIYSALLAAAEGRKITKNYRQSSLLGFVGDVGHRYSKPSRDPDEFIARVRELIPNPDKPKVSEDPTLFDYLKSHQSFGPFGSICPAIPLTKLMLNQWGRQLATDEEYVQRFRKTIIRPRNPIIHVWERRKIHAT